MAFRREYYLRYAAALARARELHDAGKLPVVKRRRFLALNVQYVRDLQPLDGVKSAETRVWALLYAVEWLV